MTGWRIHLGTEHLDTVFYDSDMTEDEVKESLICHDGYDARIELSKED